MAVHAHPDDESSQTGGTLARYAAAGVRTVLITCTDGGQGDGIGGVKPEAAGHNPGIVAAQRSTELDLAAAALGVSDVIKLGYPDSGMPKDSAGAIRSVAGKTVFSRLALGPLVKEMVELMRLYRPAVVLTYPPDGMSGHPDHIRVHDIVATAHRIIVAETSADHGTAPRMYYTALSRSRLEDAARMARAVYGDGAWVPPAEIAVDDASITTVVDVEDFWEHKLKALSAHASQGDAVALHQILSAPAHEARRRVEEFVRAFPPPAPNAPTVIEHDLFGMDRR